ncbi:MAG: M23 family metallopeptidase [Candidatus Binatia bacterium]|nr:M23 family metallopeptidase [Candidatus Binatia bacterium]
MAFRVGAWVEAVKNPKAARLLVVAVMVSCGCSGASLVYRVRPGDTLSSISARFGVSVAELARVNGLDDPNCIQAGQELRIPKRVSSSAAGLANGRLATPLPKAAARWVLARWQGQLRWPVPNGVLSSYYGQRESGFHAGVDIHAPAGSPVLAAADGEVIFAGELRGYGKTIMLAHKGGLVTLYAHNQAHLVREGQKVRKGQTIALVGETGKATGPNLHFEVRHDNALLDPLLLLPRAPLVEPRRTQAWGG